MCSSDLANSKFKNVFIYPNAGDNGLCAGQALYVHNILNNNPRTYAAVNDYLGRVYTSSEIKKCLKAFRRISKALNRLVMMLESEGPSPDTLARNISGFTPSHCTGPAREKSSRAMRDYLDENNQVVGVVLPLSGQKREYAESVLKGVQAAFSEVKSESKGLRLAVRDSSGSSHGAVRALASLALEEGVSLVIGGLLQEEATALIPFASRLVTPLLVLNKDKSLIESSSYAFQVYPKIGRAHV